MREPEGDEEGVALDLDPEELEGASSEEIEAAIEGIDLPDGSIEKDNVTHSENARHWLTNDIIGGSLLISMPIIIAAAAMGILDLGTVPRSVLYGWLMILGTASVWAFGVAAAKEWSEFKGGLADGR